MTDRFAGKTAIVTGSGSGIGRASARLLAEGQEDINARWRFYEQLAGLERAAGNGGDSPA